MSAALLVLEDGTVFEGETIATGPEPVTVGRLAVTTAMTGHQEILSDPANEGLLMAFTTPHIGNCGATAADDRSDTSCRGIIVRDIARIRSNWRSEEELSEWLSRRGLTGITGVDTRRLARHLAAGGPRVAAFGTVGEEQLRAAVAASTDGGGAA